MSNNTIYPSILIPVYNGRDSIIKLITRIRKLTDIAIIVVDDGSQDQLTHDDLGDVTYIRHDSNRGKGAALKSGLNAAQEMGFSHTITLDADGQHDPNLIEAFLENARQFSATFQIGNRDLLSADMPFHRKLSNNITSMILSLRSGMLIRDGQVGYRCYPLIDSRLWRSDEDGFQFESDVFFNASKLNIRLMWQPIPVIYGDEDSHMDLLMDTLRFVRTILRSFKW